jgi:hypothetical protein
MKLYAGLCAGGPHDGKKLQASSPRIIIPLAPPREVLFRRNRDPVSFRQGEYKFNEPAQMWIWQGKWNKPE